MDGARVVANCEHDPRHRIRQHSLPGRRAPGGDETEHIEAPPFDEMIKKHDKNKNGTLEADELPPGELKNRFTQIDRDKDNKITKVEYENMRRIFTVAQNMVVAIKPGGKGDITATHVLWSQRKYLPYVPSPLYYKGYVYMIKNGGLLSSLDAKTGKPTKQEARVWKEQLLCVAGRGRRQALSLQECGDFSVVKAGPNWEELSWGKFKEPIFATPAIADGRIYVRTEQHLYCFGVK